MHQTPLKAPPKNSHSVDYMSIQNLYNKIKSLYHKNEIAGFIFDLLLAGLLIGSAYWITLTFIKLLIK